MLRKSCTWFISWFYGMCFNGEELLKTKANKWKNPTSVVEAVCKVNSAKLLCVTVRKMLWVIEKNQKLAKFHLGISVLKEKVNCFKQGICESSSEKWRLFLFFTTFGKKLCYLYWMFQFKSVARGNSTCATLIHTSETWQWFGNDLKQVLKRTVLNSFD